MPHPRTGTLIGVALSLLAVMPAAPVRGQDWRSVRPERFERPNLPTASELARIRIDPALMRLVDEMNADSYAAREEAMQRILAEREDPLETLAILERHPLTTEQRHRLLTVVRTQMLSKPRGALGISMQEQLLERNGGPVEVVVTDLIPGLPAERVLQLGDRIFEVDGRGLFQRNEVLERVQNKEPGEVVSLAIRRLVRDEDGIVMRDEQNQMVYERLDLEITLGSADRLVDPRSGELPRPSPVVIQRARTAEAAVSRYSRSQPVPIEADMKGIELTPMQVGWAPGQLSPLKRLIAELERDPSRLELQTRQQWETTMIWLRDQSRRGDLTDEDRQDLRRAMRLVTDQMQKKPRK